MKIKFALSEHSRSFRTVVPVPGGSITITAHGRPGMAASVSIAPENLTPAESVVLRFLQYCDETRETSQVQKDQQIAG